MTNPTERELSDRLADALEESLYMGAWTLAQLAEWDKKRDELLALHRAQRDGEREARERSLFEVISRPLAKGEA